VARAVAWLGWDPRETDAYTVAKRSILRHTTDHLVLPLQLGVLQKAGAYTRPTTRVDGRLWDVISEAPMSTEHAITRFWVPFLYHYRGWSLFADCDILVRRNLDELYALADDRYAVMVVKHDYQPVEAIKMDGQVQTVYPRKNWSSVILWNCDHPAHQALRGLLNTAPGRDLHRFCWLQDEQIGELPPEWNYLVGVSPRRPNVALAHFTLGVPSMEGYEACEFAGEWSAYLR
jgi:hypothetical protein